MFNEKPQTIMYGVNFLKDSKLLHSTKCDFPVVNSKLDFNMCPIISAIMKSNLSHDFRIETDFNLNITLQSKPNIIFPKGINSFANICQNCALKHIERE